MLPRRGAGEVHPSLRGPARLPNSTGESPCPTPRRRRTHPRVRTPPLHLQRFPPLRGILPRLTTGPAPTKPEALFRAATGLLPVLEAGQTLDAATLRRAMSTAFGATDAEGAWVWKDAYEAAEAALGPVSSSVTPALCAARRAPDPKVPPPCSPCWRRSPPLSPLRPGAPKNNSNSSSSPPRCRWPTRRCRPPRSGRAIPCWNPRPAPGCWPSWPNVRSGARSRIAPPARCT